MCTISRNKYCLSRFVKCLSLTIVTSLVPVCSCKVMASYTARVLYDFTGEVAGDLTVTAGDEVTILPHLEADLGWVHATNRAGEQGILPESYTEPIDQEDQFTDEEEFPSDRRNTWNDDDDDERHEERQDPGSLSLASGPSIHISICNLYNLHVTSLIDWSIFLFHQVSYQLISTWMTLYKYLRGCMNPCEETCLSCNNVDLDNFL